MRSRHSPFLIFTSYFSAVEVVAGIYGVNRDSVKERTLRFASMFEIGEKSMRATDTFTVPEEFVKRLRSLRRDRREQRLKCRNKLARMRLSRTDRDALLKKTSGRCHICGGLIEGAWEADHVFSHSLGGKHSVENYLPAHPTCNNYRWFYGNEEFQWILKLGVWLRTQIEKETEVGRFAAPLFCSHERIRAKRRTSKR